MKGKELNYQVLIEISCYTVFFGVILRLVYTGKYLNYVTSKMMPYLIYIMAVMLIWIIFSIRYLYKPQYRKRVCHCFVLILPILLFVLPHGSVSVESLSSKLINGNDLTSASTNDIRENNGALRDQDSKNLSKKSNMDNESVGSGKYVTENVFGEEILLHGYDEENKKIIVSHDEFSQWFNEIYMNIDKYIGFKISIKGFVYKDLELDEDEFVPARLMMTCCVADLSPCGFVCKYNKASELEADTWVTVEGIIIKKERNGIEDPQIDVNNISSADPTEDYIYPY
ncbi:TIGR03943 family putative permease subunit [Metaclostridioides mangenotii]|uniref:Membrane protein n=1 Tax=Metaclostridioides mangenotii TaxID=1540 RepID=A0ABS4EDJ4_9FIRM|nr:TIGR03943 family protein [Clostridioides mangenotii]MBP1856008.1 putative membrane protein [Clostridioides mangenotii]